MNTHRFNLEMEHDVSVVTLSDRKILDESNIQELGRALFDLVEVDHRQKIILDFKEVEYLSSAALGKFITLDKKVKTARGKLRLCSIRPDIYEVFVITRLNKLFDIKENREEALKGM